MQFIFKFGFCDICNNQGLGKCYQPRPLAWLIILSSTLIIRDITKTSSNNELLFMTSVRHLKLLKVKNRVFFFSIFVW